MKFSKILASLGLLMLLGATSPAIPEDSNWYVGANLGLSRAHIDDDGILSGLTERGFSATSLTDDDHGSGYKIFGGYQINKFLALEAGYFDLGKFGFRATTIPDGSLGGNIKVRGANLDVVGLLPLTDKFSAFGRFGANHAEARDFFSTTGSVNVADPDRNKWSTHYKYGAGLQYQLTMPLAIRVEAERYRIDDADGNKGDLDLFSLGVLYRFGEHASVAAAAIPVSVASTPVLVVVPVPPQSRQYCSILDFQFEVNQDDVQRQDKEKLAVLGTFLNKYPETTAVIEGHTDDVGTSEQNLQLSKRRAENVVAYLIDAFQITPSRLSAVGYGETRPLGDNRTEEGKRRNRRIGAVVACATDIEGLTVSPARVTIAMLIEFDRNDATVKPQYAEQLKKIANFLKANPSVSATVEGHTSNLQATPQLALEISQHRAQNVINALVDQFGVERSRLSAQGYGNTRRLAYNTSLEGQQENRRVNIVINYPK